MRAVNLVTIVIASWLMVVSACVIIMMVWRILDDRSTDIAVPDDSAIARHDPNPPMKAWPRIPDSVGTSVITLGNATVCRAPNGDLMDLSACSGRDR